jgi:hypothetical protein
MHNRHIYTQTGVVASGGGGGSSYANPSYTIMTNNQGVQSGNGVLYITIVCQAGYSNCVCAAGYYYSTSTQACIACPAGTHNPTTGQTSCLACAAGKYNPFSGSTSSSACLACAAGKLSAAGASTCYTPTISFAYTGNVQQWVVPAGLATFTVDAYGAAGEILNGYIGGLGGYISASNTINSSFVNKTLFIYVGGQGGFYAQGGFNGGGNCSTTPHVPRGGGATDLRTSLSDLSSR